jgi:hypothetical protein
MILSTELKTKQTLFTMSELASLIHSWPLVVQHDCTQEISLEGSHLEEGRPGEVHIEGMGVSHPPQTLCRPSGATPRWLFHVGLLPGGPCGKVSLSPEAEGMNVATEEPGYYWLNKARFARQDKGHLQQVLCIRDGRDFAGV